jgi:hypothetical protein
MTDIQRLPIIYQDPNLRQDHFDRLSPQMRSLFLETYPESPRHETPEPPEPGIVPVEDLDDMISRTKLLATLRAVRGGFGVLIGSDLPSASIIWDTFTAAIELVEKQ